MQHLCTRDPDFQRETILTGEKTHIMSKRDGPGCATSECNYSPISSRKQGLIIKKDPNKKS
jgi:hypothetical protein